MNEENTTVQSDMHYAALLESIAKRFPFEEFSSQPSTVIDQISYLAGQDEERLDNISKKWKYYMQRLWVELLDAINDRKANFQNSKDAYYQALMSPLEENPKSYINSRSLEEFNQTFHVDYTSDFYADHVERGSSAKVGGTEGANVSCNTAEATLKPVPSSSEDKSFIEDAIILEDSSEIKAINIKWDERYRDTYHYGGTSIQIHSPFPKNEYPAPPKPNLSDLAEEAVIIEDVKVTEDVTEDVKSGDISLIVSNGEGEENPAEAKKDAFEGQPQVDLETSSDPNEADLGDGYVDQELEEPQNPESDKNAPLDSVPESQEEVSNDNTDSQKRGNFVSRFLSNIWGNKKNIAGSFLLGGALRYVAGPAYTAIVPVVSFGRATAKAAKSDYKKSLEKILSEAEENLRAQDADPENKLSFDALLLEKLSVTKSELIDSKEKLDRIDEERLIVEAQLLEAQLIFNNAEQELANDNAVDGAKQALDKASDALEKVRENFDAVTSKASELNGTIEAVQNSFNGLVKVQSAIKQQNSNKKFLSRDFWRYARDNRKSIWKGHKKQILTKTAFSAVAAVAGSAVAELVPDDFWGIGKDVNDVEHIKNHINDNAPSSGIEAPLESDEVLVEAESEGATNIDSAVELNLDERIDAFVKHAQQVRGDSLQQSALDGIQNYTEDSPATQTAWQVLELVYGSTDPELIKEASDIVQDLGLDADHAALNTADSNEAYAHALKGEWKAAVEGWAEPAQRGHATSLRHLAEIEDHNLGGFGAQAAAYL